MIRSYHPSGFWVEKKEANQMEVGVINYSKVLVLDTNGDITEATYSLPPKEALKSAVNQLVHGIWMEQNYKEVDIIETDISYMYHSKTLTLWVRR